ncbi:MULTISPECIES: fimbrial protein [unclassified Pseudomonas]|uniref:fimbrial protein n=1 Tax=unclassified Pseudomonas TaxID=196821 RepID=UPI000BD79CCB|nr:MULTISPECIES: fimbrial protein [unclassified Pseudomonas]PVZ12671.1 major type 1 subunit fimbrin (pilin) [Pseudomonas sp. URIL14HWK12:I12]PVZ23178.1 major type 1 subunit fimbrin (pilin) [Pseudomonas sp. URIL14HWK12:I10]PVZ32507.1 major type 1 subunit fimbrin (pilin) [Pseudomonas sp. URIL14HWK12:I11]SNZ13562.1 major type 1 subunit fimbrin (pilin) [Pseudomonas sp. URIL14HWK12:I9]
MFHSLSKLTLACGMGCLLAGTAFADGGQIVFTGSVTDNACTISTNDVNKSVSLDPVRIADFGNVVGAKAKPRSFSLSLDNCSLETRRNAAITFSGQPAATDSTLLGLTGENQVKGIAIQIDDARTGTKVALNTPTADYALRSQTNTFDFVASYVRTALDVTVGQGDDAVTTPGIGTGQVNALATFDVTYK